ALESAGSSPTQSPAAGHRPAVGARANWIVSPVWVSRIASVGGLPPPTSARSASPIGPSASNTGEPASVAGPSTRSTRATTSGVSPGVGDSREAQAARPARARMRHFRIMAAGRSGPACEGSCLRGCCPRRHASARAADPQCRPARWRARADGRCTPGTTALLPATNGSAHGADELDVRNAAGEIDAVHARAHGLDHDGQRLGPDLRQVPLPRFDRVAGESLDRRGKLADAEPVGPPGGIEPIPAMLRETHGSQAVQSVATGIVPASEPLVAQAGRD